MTVTINGNGPGNWDSSGNLGIGTTSPTAKLQIGNNVGSAGGANQIRVYESGSSIFGFGVAAGQLNYRGASHGFYSDTGTLQANIDSSSNLQFNSGYGSVATAYGCRAWVNFNGVGTVAVRGSGNISSITDNGVADFTANFTTAMPDTNYALSQASGANADPAGGGGWGVTISSQSTNLTTSCRVRTGVQNAFYDPYSVHITFFR